MTSKKKLIVIKIGTSSLTTENGNIAPDKIASLVDQVCALKELGHSVILVSSGAIAAGFTCLGYKTRPRTVPGKQAAAAVGQGLLMEEYTKCLLKHNYIGAQILLTRGDFTDQRRYKNAFNALEVLLQRNAIPIINENDTIAIEELKLGDNDTLAAQVAAMVHSDLLIFMTDIDGLYTANPHTNKQAQHIPVVNEITDEIEKLAGDTDNNNATGGMITKIYGAKLATAAGVPVFICRSADENVLVNAVNGQARGTLFTAKDSALKTRLQWMALYAESKGNIYIDAGAAKAVEEMGKSLLPSGIVAIEGDFLKGDVVSVYSQGDHRYIGKGIVNYNKKDVYALMGKHSSDLAFGNKKKPEIIHHDNWISEKHFR